MEVDRTSAKSGSAYPERPPWRARARAFAFDGLPEKDRFGVFDPALRASFAVLVLLGEVLLVGTTFDVLGASPAGWSAALAVAASTAVCGVFAYRRIWPTPSERELLLQMAREDDEARELRERLMREEARRAPAEGAGDAGSRRET